MYIKHGIDKEFHYWTDIIEHIAPGNMKGADGALKTEAPFVLNKGWVTPEEKMDETYLKYIMAEKKSGVKCAEDVLSLILKWESFSNRNNSHLRFNLSVTGWKEYGNVVFNN